MASVPRPCREAERPSATVDIRRCGDGLWITVPPGDPRRWAGYPFGIALCFVVPVLYLVIGALVHFIGKQAVPPPPALDIAIPLATLVCSVLLAFGLSCVVFGRRLARQHGTIAVHERQLWIDVTGVWGRVRRNWPVEQIEVIQASGSDWSSNGRPVMQLQIRPKYGPVVRLFTGRDEAMLRRIADTLREELRLPSREERQGAWLRRPARIPPLPAGSGITWEDHSDGFTLRLPPMGYWRRASGDVRGLLGFTIFWWMFLIIFTSLLLFAPWRWNGPPASPWFFLLIPGVHWLIGLGLMVLLWRWAHRYGLIRLQGDRLVIVEQGRWRPRRWQGRCEDIYAISVESESSPGGGSLEGEGRSLQELRIHTWDSAGKSFFAGRNVEDLQWVAAVLQQALQLTAQEKP